MAVVEEPEVFMQRRCVIALVLVVTAFVGREAPVAGQQTPVNWNARAPWGEQPNLPSDQQRKAPFKVFDNLWHVGIQTSSNFLIVTTQGLVLFDASSEHTGSGVVEAVRRWTSDPVHTIVYTHGHVDHVGGAGAFLADAERLGHARPRIVGHERIAARFDRYRLTNGYNLAINLRQFAPRDVDRVVLRAVVHHDHPDQIDSGRTRAQRPQTCAHNLGAVVGHHHNGDLGASS